MKLIKVRNLKTNETHYFTKVAYASEFMNEGYQATKYAMYTDRPFKREWTIEMVDDPDVKNGDIVK